MVISTVCQSCRANGKVIMKGCMQLNPVKLYGIENSTFQWDPVLNRLTYMVSDPVGGVIIFLCASALHVPFHNSLDFNTISQSNIANLKIQKSECKSKILWCFQAYLSSTDFGTTEDQVEALTRKHEAFERVLAVQEEKVCTVPVFCSHAIMSE